MVASVIKPVEIREIHDPGGGVTLELRVNGLRLATAHASPDVVHDLRVERGLSREEVRAELESQLSRLRLAPELDGQVFGYWFGPGEDVPTHPVGAPTGALLPGKGQAFGVGDLVCLDLVPVFNYWLVLSEMGRYTYRHTAGLLNGEEWRFVPIPEVLGTWPVVCDVTFARSLSPTDIEATYGFEASTRARIDAQAVQVRLRRRS